MTHELKIQSEYFEVVNNKTKTFEIRKNDRNFKVGDKILLREALKDDPITEMAKLMVQRYNIEQSIKKLLPKMTKDEVTEAYHTLYGIGQKVNERES